MSYWHSNPSPHTQCCPWCLFQPTFDSCTISLDDGCLLSAAEDGIYRLVLRLEVLEQVDRLSSPSFKYATDGKLAAFLRHWARGRFESREVFLSSDVGKVFSGGIIVVLRLCLGDDLELLRLTCTCLLVGSNRENVESSSLLVPNKLSLSTKQSWLSESVETLRCLLRPQLYQL